MKNTLISIFASLLMAIVPTFAWAQIHTTSSRELHSIGGNNMSVGASAPAAAFQSTSTGIPSSSSSPVGFRGISSVPSIGASGSASQPYASNASSGPLRGRDSGSAGENIGTPGDEANNQIPVGGPFLPLLLLAGVYVAVATRRCRNKE